MILKNGISKAYIRGASLIEVLIALLILSLALFGLDMMQVTALKKTQATYYFSVASQQLNSMAEQLYTLQEGDPSDLITQWNDENNVVLPRGKGVVSGLYPVYKVAIF